MPSTITYPLDTEGNSASNLITESHTVTQLNLSMYRILVPVHAPFYIANLVLKHVNDSGAESILNEHTDYSFCLPYEAASRSLGRLIYGGLAIVNTNLSGSFSITYQCLGGNWSANRNHVLAALAASSYNPRRVYWDQVTDVQDLFPPGPHSEDISNLKGIEALIESFDNLTNAILSRPQPTAVMLGLGQVPNLPKASDTEVALKSRVEKLVTLKQVLDIIDTL